MLECFTSEIMGNLAKNYDYHQWSLTKQVDLDQVLVSFYMMYPREFVVQSLLSSITIHNYLCIPYILECPLFAVPVYLRC